MTAQVSDVVKYRDEEMLLAAFSDGEPFSPAQYGYRPMMASTACYRGYVCEYEVAESRLLLSKLNVHHQDTDAPASVLVKPPKLNGVEAKISEASFFGRWVFKGTNLPISYTGGLIVARGFIRSLYVHMGFHPAWKYEEVHELVFESGRLASEEDLSARIAELRGRITSGAVSSSKPSRNEVEAWVAESFRRDYRRRSS